MSRSDFKYLIICCLVSKGGRIQKQISVCNCFLHQVNNRIITLTQLKKGQQVKTTKWTHQQTTAHLNQQTTSNEAGCIEEADAQGFLNHRILIKLVSKLCLQLHLQNVHLTSCPFLDRSSLNQSVVMGGFLITACCTNCFSRWCRLWVAGLPVT